MIDLPIRSPEARLRALDATALLDAPPAPAFDRVTALVRRLLDVPVSLVSLVDRDRQFFLSQDGLSGPWAEARQTPLTHSFCAHVVAAEGPIRVENAPFDPAFCDNLAIRDLSVVGYLGVPVRAPGGAVLGSLCAITPYPRAWTDAEVATMEELAAIVEAEVALQGALRAAGAEATDRREAVDELQVALDAAHLGRWEVDLATGLVTQDARARAIHGALSDGAPVPTAEAVAALHPADRADAMAAFRDVAEVGVGGRFAREYRIVDPAGETRWVRAAGQVREGERGARLVGVAWDVTDEREAEQALRRSEQRKALLLGLLQGHRQTSDPRAMLAAAAEGLGRHLGAHRVGLYRLADDDTADFDAGPCWTDGTLPRLGGRFPVAVFGAGLLDRVRNGETVAVADVEATPLTADAAFREIGTRALIGSPIVRAGRWAAGLYVNHATPRAWTGEEVALVRDVADQVWDAVERAQAEAAVRGSEAHLRAVLDGLSTFVAVLTPAGVLVEVNRSVTEASGVRSGDVAGTLFWDGPWWADEPEAQAAVRAACRRAAAGEGARFDTVAEIRGGTRIPIDFSVLPLTAPDGGVTHLVASGIDITDRQAAQAALRALNDELESRVAERTAELQRSNAELDQFAYVASHDLKAPIRAIDSLAAWIAEDAGETLPDASARHLELLRSRAARMEGLLDSLLTYSRVGRSEAAPEPVDTAALVHDAVATVAPPEGFDVRLEGDFPVAVTSRAPLELVLRNLIGNAIKHHDRPDGRVTVSADAADGWALLAVADDGPGIDSAYQERVFGLFQTLRPRDEVEGSGMGLSIVRKAVESRGGRVSLASDGRGSTFRFSWPLRPDVTPLPQAP